MFQHERRFHRALRQFGEIGTVVDRAASGNHFQEVHVQFCDPLQVLRVAGDDPLAELREALLDHLGVVVETLRTVDHVAHIQVHAERLAVHGGHQLEIRVRSVRQTPAHHLDSELGARRFHRVDRLAAVLHGRVEELAGQVPGVRPVPYLRVVRAGDIHAAAGAHRFGQGQPFGHVLLVFGALLRVGVEHVFPGAHLRDHDILGGEGVTDRPDALALG